MINRFRADVARARRRPERRAHRVARPAGARSTRSSSSTSTSATRRRRSPPAVRAFAPALWASITGDQRPAAAARPLHRQDLRAGARRVPGRAEGEDPLGDRQRRRLDPRARCCPARRPGTRRGRSPARAPTTWYLRRRHALAHRRPPTGAAARRRATGRTRRARPRTDCTGGNIWGATPTYDWQPVVDGTSLSYDHAAADADGRRWPAPATSTCGCRRRATDSDVQVTLTRGASRRHRALRAERLAPPEPPQARPDALDRCSNPFHSDEVADMQPLTPGELVRGPDRAVPVRPPVPGREPDPAHDRGARRRPPASGRSTRRRPNGQVREPRGPRRDAPVPVVLPVLPSGPDLGAAPAPCPSLRAQPCRTYVAPAGSADRRPPRLRRRVQGRQARTSEGEPRARPRGARAVAEARPADEDVPQSADRARADHGDPGRRDRSRAAAATTTRPRRHERVCTDPVEEPGADATRAAPADDDRPEPKLHGDDLTRARARSRSRSTRRPRRSPPTTSCSSRRTASTTASRSTGPRRTS